MGLAFLFINQSWPPKSKFSVSKEPELHILFNNAGVMMPPVEQITTQRYDLQFGTNVLGHFYFTTLLLPQLFAGAKSSPNGKARVINTASQAAEFVDAIDFGILKDSPERKERAGVLYPQSKLGNILFSDELARRYSEQGIVSVSVSPGNMQSSLNRHMGQVGRLIMEKLEVAALAHPVCRLDSTVCRNNGRRSFPEWKGRYPTSSYV